MTERDANLIIFFPMGALVGAIVLDAGLSLWLVPPAAMLVAIFLVGSQMLTQRLRRRT